MRKLFLLPILALSLVVIGTEGSSSTHAQVRRAARAVVVAAQSLDFGQLDAAIATYSEDVDAWEAANEATTAQAGVVADLEAQLASAQVALADLEAAEEDAAQAADASLQTVTDEHGALRSVEK